MHACHYLTMRTRGSARLPDATDAIAICFGIAPAPCVAATASASCSAPRPFSIDFPSGFGHHTSAGAEAMETELVNVVETTADMIAGGTPLDLGLDKWRTSGVCEAEYGSTEDVSNPTWHTCLFTDTGLWVGVLRSRTRKTKTTRGLSRSRQQSCRL